MVRYSKIYDIFFNSVFMVIYAFLAINFTAKHNIHDLKQVITMLVITSCAYLLYSKNSISKSFCYLILSSFCIGYLYLKEYHFIENISFDQLTTLTIFSIIFLVPPFDIVSGQDEHRQQGIIELILQYIFIFCVSVSINEPKICSVFSLVIIFSTSLSLIYNAREIDGLSLAKFYISLLLFAYDKGIDIELGKALFCTLFIVNIAYKIVIEKTEKIYIRNIMYVITGAAPLVLLHEMIEAYIFTIYLLLLHIFLPKFGKLSNALQLAMQFLASLTDEIEYKKYDINCSFITLARPKINLSFAIIFIFFILGIILII